MLIGQKKKEKDKEKFVVYLQFVFVYTLLSGKQLLMLCGEK